MHVDIPSRPGQIVNKMVAKIHIYIIIYRIYIYLYMESSIYTTWPVETVGALE